MSVASLFFPAKLTSTAGHRQHRDQRERREDALVGARHISAFPGCRRKVSGSGKKEKIVSFRRFRTTRVFFSPTANQGGYTFLVFFSLLSFQQRSQPWCRARCAWPSCASVSIDDERRREERRGSDGAHEAKSTIHCFLFPWRSRVPMLFCLAHFRAPPKGCRTPLLPTRRRETLNPNFPSGSARRGERRTGRKRLTRTMARLILPLLLRVLLLGSDRGGRRGGGGYSETCLLSGF